MNRIGILTGTGKLDAAMRHCALGTRNGRYRESCGLNRFQRERPGKCRVFRVQNMEKISVRGDRLFLVALIVRFIIAIIADAIVAIYLIIDPGIGALVITARRRVGSFASPFLASGCAML
ncbi:MAG: hypothetical protein IPK99_12250 [Flavobacteriales bacterium]|nr:hypothetical protein [Flavobacteriales bacterium]